MNYRHPLPPRLLEQASTLIEFANGAAQCHVKLNDGQVLPGVLISNSTAFIAMRGFRTLPFTVEEVQALVQMNDDTAPVERANWEYFDDWAPTVGEKQSGESR